MLLIDISNVMHRCYHALADLATNDGTPTGMEYGCLKALEGYVKRYPDQEVIVCFDNYRKENRPDGYKGGRTEKPSDFGKRMEKLGVAIRAKYHYAIKDDTEADQVIYGLALRPGYHIIISSDKDLFQCLWNERSAELTWCTEMHSEFRGKVKEWTTERVWREFKVRPNQWAIYRSLIGDPSDNLPGCKGLGKELAAEITRASFHVEPNNGPVDRVAQVIFSDDYYRWMSDRLKATVDKFFRGNEKTEPVTGQMDHNYDLIRLVPMTVIIEPPTGEDISNYLKELEINTLDETEF